MKKNIILIIILLITVILISWFLLKKQSINNIDTTTKQNTIISQGDSKSTRKTNMVTFFDQSKNYTFQYPKNFSILKLVGEGVPLGIAVSDPQTKRGTFEEVNIHIYDQKFFDYGRELGDSKIFNFNEGQINSIDDLKKTPEFKNSESISVNKLTGLKKTLNDDIYVVLQNPLISTNFITFEVSERGGKDYSNEITKSHDLLNQILSTFKFKK